MRVVFFLLILSGLLLSGSPLKAQLSAETATMVQLQTTRQSIWHTIMKRVQTIANQHLKRSSRANQENLGLQKTWFKSLEQISSAVRNYKRVKTVITRQLLIVNIQREAMRRFAQDQNFKPEEIRAIGNSYKLLVEESISILTELRLILRPRALKMNDSERLEAINRLDDRMKFHYGLVRYYTDSMVEESRMRSETKSDIEVVNRLYGLE